MMKGSEEDKEKVIKKRILKFFREYQPDLFHVQRREVEPKTTQSIFPNGLLLYGIDFLSEERIISYFQPYHIDVVIFDDSHC